MGIDYLANDSSINEINKMNEAIKTLFKFIESMNNWENEAFYLLGKEFTDESDFISTKNYLKNKLSIIFNEFCVLKSQKQSRLTSLHCGNPPGYDIKQIKLISCEEKTKNKVTILIQQLNSSKNKYRYTLIYKNKWFISKKEWLSLYDEKWILDTI